VDEQALREVDEHLGDLVAMNRPAALTQRELMAAAARIVLADPHATEEGLVRAIFADPVALFADYPRLHEHGVAFDSARWTPYPHYELFDAPAPE
jgi:hypothetical protein